MLRLIVNSGNCFSECPNYEKVIPVALKEGVKMLPEKCKITPGTQISLFLQIFLGELWF